MSGAPEIVFTEYTTRTLKLFAFVGCRIDLILIIDLPSVTSILSPGFSRMQSG